jgi:hypothetical protein
MYRRALELDDANEEAYVGMSAILDSSVRHEEALGLLRIGESLIGWTASLAIQRGIHQSRLRRWDQVVSTLSRVLEGSPQAYESA